MTFPIIPGGSPSGAYQISRSLRFRASNSAYLSRTFGTPTNNTVWTYSTWLKLGALPGSTNYTIFGTSGTGNQIAFGGSGSSHQYSINFATTAPIASTTALYRDPSAWSHYVFTSDGTYVKAYVNNQLVLTYTGTMSALNTAAGMQIGKWYTTDYFDGYMAEVNFIDGQALTPSSFGQTDPTTGVWSPLAYTGAYGTNGFYLKFADNSGATATTIGKDSSGNGNNWTPSGISVTAGTTNDSLVDSPTNYGSDTGAGGEVRGNYAVLNPNFPSSSSYISRGNLYATGTAPFARSTMSVPATGQFYYEVYVTAAASGGYLYGGSAALYKQDGTRWAGSSWVSYGASYTAGDTIGCAIDTTNNTVTWYKNNTSQGTITTNVGLSRDGLSDTVGFDGAGTWTLDFNFGQRPFSYTAPSGFKALCTQNLTTPAIALPNSHFDAVVRTGTGASASVSSLAFKPDVVWIKSRSNATDHALLDGVRGAANVLFPNLTLAEDTTNAYGFAFTSNGYSYNSSATINGSARTYVDWCWRGGNSSGSSNTSGTITSTVSANTTAGFSVVTYTGTGANATVGHGLGVAPSMIICKNRDVARGWGVYHSSLGNTKNIILNSTGAANTSSLYWNNTSPTSTVFSVGSDESANESTKGIVAYCFAAIPGFSAFGSYTGNGSADGTFVFCGFRPRWVLFKNSTSAGNGWFIYDTSRNTYNVMGASIFVDSAAAENAVSLSTENTVDYLSNGFKLRSTNAGNNQSGQTIIYAAFAENPFKYSRAR
jgi:hypothetical protein